MPSKQKTYETLILLILICFGFFGSLSHLFSLSLIVLNLTSLRVSISKNEVDFKSKILFLSLSGVFFLFCITGIFRSNFSELLQSLGPMLPLPLIGMLVLLHNCTEFKLSAEKISQFAQASIFFCLIVVLILSNFNVADSIFDIHTEGRLTLFSGNPIPFSFVMLGISIFCLTNWRNSTYQKKLIAFLIFSVGIYFAGILSGTRGTLLTIIIISPIIIFYLTNNLKISIFIILVSALIAFIFLKISFIIGLDQPYFNRITNGLETMVLSKNIDSSAFQRLEMWSAAIKAISDRPFFGYGILERFSSLEPYLYDFKFKYTHPHNDVFASLISSGFLGGIAAIILLLSTFFAALIGPNRSSEKVLFGLIISISALTTANVSTIIFNDISSAWLAFSTYLIWVINFKNVQAQPLDANY